MRAEEISSRTEPEGGGGYRISHLSRQYGLPRATLYSWIKSGVLPAVRVGDVLLVLRDDWGRFLDTHRTQPSDDRPAMTATN